MDPRKLADLLGASRVISVPAGSMTPLDWGGIYHRQIHSHEIQVRMPPNPPDIGVDGDEVVDTEKEKIDAQSR